MLNGPRWCHRLAWAVVLCQATVRLTRVPPCFYALRSCCSLSWPQGAQALVQAQAQKAAAAAAHQQSRSHALLQRLPPADDVAKAQPGGGGGGWPTPAALAERKATWAKTGVIALRDLRLDCVPDGLLDGALAGARVLDACGNRLAQLPSSLDCLTGLTALKLSGNALTPGGIPWPALGALTNLVQLTLDGNRLSSLPSSPSSPASTPSSPLAQEAPPSPSPSPSPSHHPPLSAPQPLLPPALRRLVLSGNQLAQLPAAALAGLSRLQSLELDSNSLRELPSCLGERCHL